MCLDIKDIEHSVAITLRLLRKDIIQNEQFKVLLVELEQKSSNRSRNWELRYVLRVEVRKTLKKLDWNV